MGKYEDFLASKAIRAQECRVQIMGAWIPIKPPSVVGLPRLIYGDLASDKLVRRD